MKKYIVVREDDDRRWEADTLDFITWDKWGRALGIKSEIELKSSMALDYENSVYFLWLTTPIQEIVSDTKNHYFRILRFRTKNSTYKVLEKL